MARNGMGASGATLLAAALEGSAGSLGVGGGNDAATLTELDVSGNPLGPGGTAVVSAAIKTVSAARAGGHRLHQLRTDLGVGQQYGSELARLPYTRPCSRCAARPSPPGF